MYTVCLVVESDGAERVAEELPLWAQGSGAAAHRMYAEEDGCTSVFIDYADEAEARAVGCRLKDEWPFEGAALMPGGKSVLVVQAADCRTALD